MNSLVKLKKGILKTIKVLHKCMSFSGLCISSRMERDNKSYIIFQRKLHHVQKFPIFSSFSYRSDSAIDFLVMNEYELRFLFLSTRDLRQTFF